MWSTGPFDSFSTSDYSGEPRWPIKTQEPFPGNVAGRDVAFIRLGERQLG
jgi:hypothetical protein